MRDEETSRLLVTGAAGLIGTKVVYLLRQLGYDVITLDLKEHNQRGTPIDKVGDLLDPGLRFRALQGVSGVVHLAAVSRVIEAEADPKECTRVNLQGTRDLLLDMVSRRCPPWFIFASSREVYGEAQWLPVDEGHVLAPLNHYGRTKIACEALVRTYANSARRAGTILRFSNVYGSALDHEARLVPSFIQRALLDQELRVFGGEQIMDLIHVRDAAYAIERTVSFIDHCDPWATTINVGSGIGTSMKELIELIEDSICKQVSVRLEPSRKSSVNSYIADTRLMNQMIGFECQVSLQSGLGELVECFKQRLRPLSLVVA